jgi:hypothetical protein
MKRVLSETEILSRLDNILAYDLLTDAYTNQEVAELIHEAGGNAEMIGKRGEALVAILMEQLGVSSPTENRNDADKRKSGL